MSFESGTQNTAGRKPLHKSTIPLAQGAAALAKLVYVLIFYNFLRHYVETNKYVQ